MARYSRFSIGNQIKYGVLSQDVINITSGFPWFKDFYLTEEFIDINDVIFLPPVEPTNIICAAENYTGAKQDKPTKEPLIFLKSPNSLITNRQPIICSSQYIKVWGEPELAFVVNTDENRRNESCPYTIGGYTIVNDVTAQDINKRDHHLALSKSRDTFCPILHYIDTDFSPNNQRITGIQNNKIIRDARLGDRIFNDQKLLSYLASWMTISDGDLILTGTPRRVCERTFMNDGSTYTCIIEGLGSFSNEFKITNS